MTAPATTTAPASVLAATGRTYFPIAFLARLPFAMNVVGVLTIVVAATGSMRLGGLTSAAVGLGTAVVGPFLGAAADRFGQRQVLMLAAIGNALALLALSWIAFIPDVSLGALVAIAVVVGATAPQVSPLSRTRLIAIIGRVIPEDRRAKVLGGTLAYESAADEIVFVFGPVIVGLLATTLNPAAPLIGAAVLTLICVMAFALHPTARAAGTHHSDGGSLQAPVRELARVRVLVTVLGMLGVGFFFGSTLTSLTAFMGVHAHAESAGVMYGAMGIGSAILALSASAFPAKFALWMRVLVFSLILVAGGICISQADSIPTMLVGLSIAGLGIGPLIVTWYTLATVRTPLGRSATLMTMVGSGVVVGQASASAVVGILAEEHGVEVALMAPLVSAIVVLLAAGVNGVLPSHDRV